MQKKVDISIYHALANASLLRGVVQEEMPLKNGYLSSGRDALLFIAKRFSEKKTIHIPIYFCSGVEIFLKNFFDVKYYIDSPVSEVPNFNSIKAKSKDIVLIVNYFGLKDKNAWQKYVQENSDLIFVEDHSHSPFSNWAMNSSADFSFASLRKYLPIPDGAYLFCKKVSIPNILTKASLNGESFATKIAQAMYLKELAICDRNVYQKLFLSGEEELFHKKSISQISAMSLELLNVLDINKIKRLRKNFVTKTEKFFKEKNICEFISPKNKNDSFLPLLKFNSLKERESFRQKLISKNIYPQCFWNFESDSCKDKSISQKLLALPIDLNLKDSATTLINPLSL